jgi:hypothetical protein
MQKKPDPVLQVPAVDLKISITDNKSTMRWRAGESVLTAPIQSLAAIADSGFDAAA